MSDLWQGDRHDQVVSSLQCQMAFVEQIQSQLKIEDGAVAPCWQMAAEFAQEQRIRGGTCWRGDISGNLGAAADPVMDVVTQVGSQITAVWQDVQRNTRERKEGGDILQEKKQLNYCWYAVENDTTQRHNSTVKELQSEVY